MPVELIGWIAPRISSELILASGPCFDANVIAETACIHERAGFDRVLIGYFSDAPDGFLIGAHAASVTEGLGFLLAHRPGFVSPPLAARKLATLDQLSNGRLERRPAKRRHRPALARSHRRPRTAPLRPRARTQARPLSHANGVARMPTPV